ncbi:hypothetical protein VTI74DRAFT_4356 [Chaetomium olivicolor]
MRILDQGSGAGKGHQTRPEWRLRVWSCRIWRTQNSLDVHALDVYVTRPKRSWALLRGPSWVDRAVIGQLLFHSICRRRLPEANQYRPTQHLSVTGCLPVSHASRQWKLSLRLYSVAFYLDGMVNSGSPRQEDRGPIKKIENRRRRCTSSGDQAAQTG